MDNRRHTAQTGTAIRVCVLIALVLLSGMPVNAPSDSAAPVYIVTAPGSEYQLRVANTFIKKLSADGIDAVNVSASKVDSLAYNSNTVFVTFDGSTSGNVKQLYGDNPRLDLTYNSRYVEPVGSHNTAYLVLTQPTCRLVLFLHKLVPSWKSAGVITSKVSSKQIEELRQCARQHDIELRSYQIENEMELVKILEKAVEQNDVLLALADTVVYNSRTIKNILLTAYRHRKPVIGYSNSLVKAGTVAAIYTSAEDAGIQAAEIIRQYASSQGCFNRSIYTPSTFTVSINRQVARALDISIDPDADFSDDLDLLEIR